MPLTNLAKTQPGLFLKRALEMWAWRFLVIGIVLILVHNAEVAGRLVGELINIRAEQVNSFIFEIGIAFTVAACLILTSERQLKTEMEDTFTSYLTNLKDEWRTHRRELYDDHRNALRSIENVHRLSLVLPEVHDRTLDKPEIAELLRELFPDYAKGLKSVRDGFSVDDRNWTMVVMTRFYRLLQKSTFQKHIDEIRVTHPGPAGIWEDLEEGREALTAQRDLALAKGVHIHRIFVGEEQAQQLSKSDSKYHNVMSIMPAFNILLYYVKRPKTVRDITWIPSLGIFMEWFLREGGQVARISVRSDVNERADLEAMWRALMEDVETDIGFVAPTNQAVKKRIAAAQLAPVSP